jgi:hypothetical protein
MCIFQIVSPMSLAGSCFALEPDPWRRRCEGFHYHRRWRQGSPKSLFDPSFHFSAPYFTLVLGLLPNVGTVTTFKVARVEGKQQAAHISQKQYLSHRTKNIQVNLSLTWLGDRQRAR